MSEEYYEEPVEEEEAGQLMADKEKNMGHDQSSLTGSEEKAELDWELDCRDSSIVPGTYVTCCLKTENLLGKRLQDTTEIHLTAEDMCENEGEHWDLCWIDDLMSRQIDLDLDSLTEPYGFWVQDQCEPFIMLSVDVAIEHEAVGMNGEFNASNDSGSAIDADSMMLGAGIGAVVVLLVAGLFLLIMKWRKNSAKGHEKKMDKVVDVPNVVHVQEDSNETSDVMDAGVPTPVGGAVNVTV